MATQVPQMQTIHKTKQIHKMQQITVRTVSVMQVTQQEKIVTVIQHLIQQKTSQKMPIKIQQKAVQVMLQIVQNNRCSTSLYAF